MANSRRKAERRFEITALVEEGRAAFAAGKSRQSNPYNPRLTANGDHWLKGWDAAQYEADREAEQQSGDLAVAIGEDAFRAGWEACQRCAASDGDWHTAWSAYDPPEELKGRSL